MTEWDKGMLDPSDHDGNGAETIVQVKRTAAVWDFADSSGTVRRTHRVVRARATKRAEQKRRVRSLWAPLAVCFGMLALLAVAIWNLLDESEFLAGGLPDAAQQMLMISMWVLPLSVLVLAVVWYRRTSRSASDRGPQ